MNLHYIALIYLPLVWSSPLQEPRRISSAPHERIFNGSLARKNQFPWQAAIYIPKASFVDFCGGAIISDSWILTSGRCIVWGLFKMRIALGSTTLDGDDPNRVEIYSNDFFLHEAFDPYGFENDIGVIHLSTPLTFNDYIKPIALATEEIDSGVPVTLSGWGRANDDQDSMTPDLNYAVLSSVSYEDCLQQKSNLSPGSLCTVANSTNVQNVCSGDGGGALVIDASTNPIHVGLPSWISSCESDGLAGYSSTAYYRDWIKNITGV